MPVLSDTEFQLFQQFLLKEAGLHFHRGQKYQIESGLNERLFEKKVATYHDYYNYLMSHPEDRLEKQSLINSLTVQETSFFRNSPQFGALKDLVIPEIVRKRLSGKRYLRIWSAGCSTGQEPYSIGMIVRGFLPMLDTWDVSILATDINNRALDTARRGIYSQRFSRPVRKEDLDKYFVQQGEELAVSETIRQMITFAPHNLCTERYDHPFMQQLDIIFCRNVTIYFNLETTRKVIERFQQKLVEGGYLFIGHSETLWKISDQFQPVEFPRTFIYRKERPVEFALQKPFVPIEALPYETRKSDLLPSTPVASVPSKDENTLFDKAVQAVKTKEYEKALSLFMRFKAGEPRYNEAQMAQATILSNQGRYEEAIAVLKHVLSIDNLYEEAYYLLGVLYNRGGRYDKAVEMFQKTLYANPQNPLASFYLAEIHLRLGNAPIARKSYQNTLKILESLSPDQVIPSSGDLTVRLLTQTCLKQMELIESA